MARPTPASSPTAFQLKVTWPRPGPGVTARSALAALYAVNTLGRAWLVGCELKLLTGSGQRVVGDIRRAVFDHVQGLCMGFFDRTQQGRVIARVDRDVDALERSLVWGPVTARYAESINGMRVIQASGREAESVAAGRGLIQAVRALLAEPRILILDEATSSLDSASERTLQGALKRLSTIRTADRILVFAGGKVVEEGTHAALLERGGPCARLHADAFSTPAGWLDA